MEIKNTKVCVTGGAGYIGSSLVKNLLERGYTVHATLRNLGDAAKVGVLKGLPYAEERLVLFQADIYNSDEFVSAIQGCEVVFHVATPLQHNTDSSWYKNTTEAAIAGVKGIVECCRKTGTVKRIIYTASVVAASPLKDDGQGFKDTMDETCWTPLNLSFAYSNESLMAYTDSKTLAEKEVLVGYNGDKMEVVSLACGLVGGDTLLSYIPGSMASLIAQYLMNKAAYETLRFLEELLGKVPILHIEDVIAAHIFCMENPVPCGRYLCASDYLKTAEIATYLEQCQSDIKIGDGFVEDSMREISWGSSKLEELGFQYNYDAKKIISDSIQCARRVSDAKLTVLD